MAKTKNTFEVKKINKRKKALPITKLSPMKRFLRRHQMTLRRFGLAVLAVAMMLGIQSQGGLRYLADVLQTPPPFTGTVYPVDKVPDWTNFKGDKTTNYSDITPNSLIPLPAYDLNRMQIPDASLKWGNKDDDITRNEKITYPVVYLGGYEFTHTERVGSHPAVDIKMPMDTPVKSIANGRVTKVLMQESGFGHHVVIEMRNVPDPDDASKKTTLYVGFNHMDKVYVTEGQAVKKGEVIGTSGNTGTSTTPHLHFQIDRDSAPYHPYWPFTSQEQAGLSFFDAVSSGLGLEKAEQYTINPMNYVTKYLNYSGVDVSDGPDLSANSDNGVPDNHPASDGQQDTQTSSPSPQQEPQQEVVVETPQEAPGSAVDPSLFAFDLTGEKTGIVNNGLMVTATDNSHQIDKLSDTDEVQVKVSGVGRVSKSSFRKVDFNNNSIQFIINSSDPGVAQVEVGKSVFIANFVDQVHPIASLKIETDGNFQKGQVEVIKLVAVDEDGASTPVANFSGVINIRAKKGQATFTPAQVESKDFKNGVAQVQMLASTGDTIVVRAQNGAIVGESDDLYPEAAKLFSDVGKSSPYYEAIHALAQDGVINGYSDGTFKPNLTVNRVEALKMLTLAFNLDTDSRSPLPFTDTDPSAWYAQTLATAVGKAIVKGYSDGTFKPSNVVNVAEYLKILYLTAGIQPNVQVAANPYADVPKDSWFAPFAYLTNKQNLIDVTNNRLNANEGMTRGNVAETIYRLKYIQDHNLVTYSR